eukprot:gene24830-28052_t
MKCVCPYEAENRVIAIKTFESDSEAEFKATIQIGTAGVVDHVSVDSDGHPEDAYIKFDGIHKEQWVLRMNQTSCITGFPKGQDSGIVLTWRENASTPWGLVKSKQNGQCHLRKDAVLRGKENVGPGTIIRFRPQMDEKGMSALDAVVLGSAEAPTFLGHILRYNDCKQFGFLTSPDVEKDIFFHKPTSWKSRFVDPAIGIPVEFSLEEGIGGKPPHAEKKFHELPGGKGGKVFSNKGGKVTIAEPLGKGNDADKGFKGHGAGVGDQQWGGKGLSEKGWGGSGYKGDKQDEVMDFAKFSGAASASAYSQYMAQKWGK